MKLEIRNLEDRRCEFLIEGVHPYFVNALRRVLLAEVPKLAIDEVTFYDNTSALFDETLAHRLGLLPIPTDPATLNLAGKTDEEGNPEYIVRYTLTKEGPCMVYSGDMECEDKDFEVADPKIPLVELLEGQRLILEATAILGTGTEHAKWQVCSAAGYKYYPKAHIDNRKITEDEATMAVSITPEGVLAADGGKIVVKDEERVNLANEVEQIRDAEGVKLVDKGAFRIDYDDRKFLFAFETDGSLKADDALMKAVELLKERFKGMAEQIDAI